MSTTEPFPPTMDAARTYPAVAAVRHALRHGDWGQARQAFDGAGSVHEQHLMVAQVDQIERCEVFLRSVLGSTPGDLVAATMLARRQLIHGTTDISENQFGVRTPGLNDQLRQQQWDAEKLLIAVIARDPGNAPAWATRLISAQLFGLDVSESQRRYARLNHVSPHDLIGQRAMISCLTSNEKSEMAHSFALTCGREAPAGHPNAALIVAYHLDDATRNGQPVQQRFQNQATIDEVITAANRAGKEGAPTVPGWESSLSLFALAFCLMEDWQRARHCFARLGPSASKWGWDQMDASPEAAFSLHRERAFHHRD